MNTLLICLTVVTVAGIIAAAYVYDRPTWGEPDNDIVDEKSEVIITLRYNDHSVRGIVTSKSDEFLELSGVTYNSNAAQANVGGVVRVPRTNVLFVQVLAPQVNATTD